MLIKLYLTRNGVLKTLFKAGSDAGSTEKTERKNRGGREREERQRGETERGDRERTTSEKMQHNVK